MKKILVFLVLINNFLNLKAQEIVGVTHIKSESNKTVTIEGNLKDGVLLSDLSWAWGEENNCFSQSEKLYFNGNHVLFSTNLPPFSQMQIKITPKNKISNLSIYAYLIHPENSSIVPNVHECIECKTDFGDEDIENEYFRKIVYQEKSKEPYRVILGIVGAKGLEKGEFILEIEIKTLN